MSLASRKRRQVVHRLPHQLLLQHPEDLDLDVMRRRALLGLQVRAGLDASPADKGVYETDAWDPSKPFVADKLLRLPCMRGKPVVYSCSTVSLKPKQGACGGAEGTIAEDCTIQCAGCSFRGGRTRYEQHLGSGSKKVSQHLWMKEERISIKDLAVLCSAVDLNVWHCCYCRSDEPPTKTTPRAQQAPATGADDTNGNTAAAATAAAARGGGSPDAAAAAAAAAGGSGEAESGGGPLLNSLVACSTCPGAFHTSCYQRWTGEQVGADDDWQCISCRQGAACAAAGCCWCTAHHPQQRGFTMEGLFRDLLSELQPQPAVREEGEGPGLGGTAGRAAGEQAAAAPGPGVLLGVAASGQRLSLKRPASSSGAAQLGPEPARATPAPTPTPATPRVAPPAAAVAQAPAAAAAAAGCEGGKVASLQCPPALEVTADGLVVRGGAAAACPLTPAGLLMPEQGARQQPGSSSPTAGMALLAAFGSGGGASGSAGGAVAAAGGTAAAAAAAGGGGAGGGGTAAAAAAAAGASDQPSGGAAGPCSPPPAKRTRRQNGSTAAAAAGRAQTRATDQQRQTRQSQPQQQQKEELQQEQAAPSQQQPCVPACQQQGQQQQQPLAPVEQQQQQPLAPVPQQQHRQQQQQQQQQPPSSGSQQQAPLLPLLGLLNRAVPWLPAEGWTNHYAAEASIYCLLDRAGAPDTVVAQAQGVLGALRGLPPTHTAVCRFQADYALLHLWARRRNGPQVEAALRRLLSPG